MGLRIGRVSRSLHCSTVVIAGRGRRRMILRIAKRGGRRPAARIQEMMGPFFATHNRGRLELLLLLLLLLFLCFSGDLVFLTVWLQRDVRAIRNRRTLSSVVSFPQWRCGSHGPRLRQ